MNGPLPLKINWFGVLADLQRAGYSLEKVSYFTGIPRTTLIDYRQGSEPLHYRGAILAKFWRETTLQSDDDLPMLVVYPRHVVRK